MVISRVRVVKLYLVFALCMASEVFIRIFSGVGTSSSSGSSSFFHSENSNPILLAFTGALVVWTLALALPAHRRITTKLLSAPWLTCIYLEAACSVGWSVEPTATFRYSVYLWVYLLAGLICSLYLEIEETIQIVGNTMCVMALLSVAAQYFYPQQNAAPGWTGIYGEKNHLGIGMVIGITALALPRTRWTAYRLGQIALCASLLILSQSGTALVCTLVTVTLLLCLRVTPRLRKMLVPMLAGSAAIAFALIPNLLDRLLAIGGKDATLTGRDVIWRFTVQQWSTRPVLGWGYSAFWSSQDALIQQHLGWNPSYSHNGFLEVALSLGLLGDFLIIGLLVSTLILALRVARFQSELAGTWLLLLLLVVLLHDVTEVDFLIPAPLWVVFGLSFFSALAVRRTALPHAVKSIPSLMPLSRESTG